MLCQSPFAQLPFLQDRKQIYQFLDFCHKRSTAENQIKIASIALKLDAVDPLVVLHQLSQPKQLHFYFESRDHKRSIAAIGTAVSLAAKGKQRFFQAKAFIQKTLDQLLASHPFELPWLTPRFFCSFTFFENQFEPDSPFPPATLFLPRWQIIRWQEHHTAIVNLQIDSGSNLKQLTEQIWQEFQSLQQAQYDLFQLPQGISKLMNQWEVVDTNSFKPAVVAALKSIQKNRFHKLVAAHAIDVISQFAFQWGRSLHNLRQLHPDCTVFSIGNGAGQSFIGASPERLLSIQNHRLLTDALAGSAPRGRSVSEDTSFAQRLHSSDKERHEHQVVVDFITQRLVHLGLTPQFTATPGLLKLSNIQHLHTPIQSLLPGTLHPLDIVAELHPTPAVAGLPRDIACEQIRQHEGFERSLYAAPLGWIDPQGNAEFIVGIRSAMIDGYRARLYAGAGIVAGSNPDRELAEVRLKLQALLRALV